MATVTQRGLGKGLSALISENYIQPKTQAATGEANAASGVYTQPLSKLHAGKYQPRRHFNEAAMAELAESIRKNGIMQPIIVRHSATAGSFEIVAGERRWRAAQLAGLNEAPVIIRDIGDKQALELALVENIQRQDLNPLEEALGYQQLIEEFDYTQEELGGTVGKSRSHVANMLRLLALPEEVRHMLEQGLLTMGHARALLTAENSVELAHEIVRKGLSVRQAEQSNRQSRQVEKRPTARRQSGQGNHVKDPDIIALEETLSDNLGLNVSINDRGQSGEIIIRYDTLSQLDDILRRMNGSF